MKVHYCTCSKNSKETFSTGFLIYGITTYAAVTGILALPFPLELRTIPLLLLIGFLWGMWGWNYLEAKREALFLNHSQKCARRFARLAAFSTTKGYGPEYREIRKTKGYTSLFHAIMKSLFGRKKTKVLHAGAVLASVALIAFILWMSYDGLTRERQGLPEIGGKYTPVTSEAVWTATATPILIMLAYLYLKPRTNHPRMLLAGLVAAGLFVWLGFVWLVSWYAHHDFWASVGAAAALLAAVAVILALVVAGENYWRKHRRTRRRKNARQ